MGRILQMRRACDAALAGLASEDGAGINFVDPEVEDSARWDGSILSLDEYWDAISFLLTDKSWSNDLPQGFLFAGKRVGADVAFGPVRVLNFTEVALIDQYLQSLPHDFIAKKLDIEALRAAEIYSMNWDSRSSAIDKITPHFDQLRAFVAKAVSEEQGIAHVLLVSWAGARRLSKVPPEVAGSDAVRLCSDAGVSIIGLQSAGWVWPIGLEYLDKALIGDEREMFVGREIVMGVIETDRGVLYSYSSEMGAVLISSSSPYTVVANFRRL